MAVREYNFVNGPETASTPSSSDPSSISDLVNLGYANSHYARGVDDVAALKAISAANRSDNLPVFVDSLNEWFIFDSGSSATGNDVTVITPTAGSGRWLRLHKKNTFTLTDSQASFANVTGLVFDKSVIRTVLLAVTAIRGTSARASLRLFLLATDGTNWAMSDGPGVQAPDSGDDGLEFQITSAGQIQYKSDAGASSTLNWKILDITGV